MVTTASVTETACPEPSWSEADRIRALDAYAILDTDREPAFDEVAELAADLLDAPIAVVNFIASDRQWFKAEIGIGADSLPLDVSICRHAILQSGIMVVPDLRDDQRFADNPLVDVADGLRFYAGALLETPAGIPLGTVCVLDRTPRPQGLSERQARLLRVLARRVMAELELRRALAQNRQQAAALHHLGETNRRVQAVASDFSATLQIVADGALAACPAAAGATIEFVEGDSVVYRAAAGASASHIGLRIARATSLAGASIAARSTLVSRDTRIDERVDRAACVRVGAVALLATPVFRHDQAVGVLKLQSPKPDAFSPHDAVTIELFAGLLGTGFADAAEIAAERAGRRVGEQLARSEARLRAVLAAVPVGLIFADAKGEITGSNDVFETIVGHSVLPSKSTADYGEWIAHHADGRRVEAHEYPMAQVIEGQAERPELEVLYRRGDGRDAWVRFIAAPVRDEAGQLQGGVVASLDIDRERRLTENLAHEVDRVVAEREDALARLHEAQKMETMGQLTGGVAHDFNNLLTPIIGGLDLLRLRIKDDERALRYIDAAAQSAERAKTLVQRLLSFARRQTLAPRAVDLTALIGGMEDLIARSLGRDVIVIVEAEQGLPAARIDPHQLELAILNLCVNARDAMPHGGTITLGVGAAMLPPTHVHTCPSGTYLRLSVADTGGGMDETTRARAIEPFFSTKEVGKGTGLGLSMVHGLAVQSGGAFEVTSTVGAGTQVVLWLPIADRQAEGVEGPPADGSLAGNGRILVVDDEALVRATTAEGLRAFGYEVVEAASAAEALHALQSGQDVQLVVTDHLMPGRTGTELARDIATHFVGVPVILITGNAEFRGFESITTQVVTKPFHIHDLATRVKRTLAHA